jgi:hypothetical protein
MPEQPRPCGDCGYVVVPRPPGSDGPGRFYHRTVDGGAAFEHPDGTIHHRPPVDRYRVNDDLTALAASFGVELDDHALNELTHAVADVLDGRDVEGSGDQPDLADAHAPVTTPVIGAVPAVQPGQVIDIPGHRRWTVALPVASRLLAADPETEPVTLVAAVGAVLRIDGHGLVLVELDSDREAANDDPGADEYPALTELILGD